MQCNKFDVIIIGAGHAGTEAALAAARLGVKTLLLTHNLDLLGQMSCNPAIGGIGKGHLVKEIDALGGFMAKASDFAGIQFRTLNASKGPAVRATRAQTDRLLYRQAIRSKLHKQPNLTIFQQAVDDLIIEHNKICGVITQIGLKFYAKAVVLTTGTFLGGVIHIGEYQTQGGRAGDPPANKLAKKLRDLALPVGRLKTGTPPRIAKDSIDYSKMVIQPGDSPRPVFSFMHNIAVHPQQLPCHITHTTEKTHEIIRNNLHRSPMYAGVIEGVGPRYCPSIEDKVVRFSEKNSHQIFVEPEGLTSFEIYPNGISTSLPYDVQQEFVQSIIGFEHAQITRPGYAIEYDYFDPRGLNNFLQTKVIENLFFAGQINGTTGYEEAAAQGLIAGLNAARYCENLELWSPRRDEAYIGVLIDDLITRGTQEPYRMFTSRAEYRLLLREDNADARLTPIGHKLGLVSPERWEQFEIKQSQIAIAKHHLENCVIKKQYEDMLQTKMTQDLKAAELIKRPEIDYNALQKCVPELLPAMGNIVSEQVTIQAKYAGYILRQQEDIAKLNKQENLKLSATIDYSKISGLSAELCEKLMKIRPATLLQASRIDGITPAALSLITIYLKKHKALVNAGV